MGHRHERDSLTPWYPTSAAVSKKFFAQKRREQARDQSGGPVLLIQDGVDLYQLRGDDLPRVGQHLNRQARPTVRVAPPGGRAVSRRVIGLHAVESRAYVAPW